MASSETGTVLSTTDNPLQPREDEIGDRDYDEEHEEAKKAFEALGYFGHDYDNFVRGQRGKPTEDEELDREQMNHPRQIFGPGNLNYRIFYVGWNLAFLVALITFPEIEWTAASAVSQGFLLTITMILYFLVQGSDPGYVDAPIPSNGPADAEMIDTDEFSETKDSALELGNIRNTSVVQSVGEDDDAEHGHESMLHWKSFPPMRTVFCKAKQRYVAKFDHFCAITNTPIGEKNHCLFWWLLFFQTCTVFQAVTIAKTGFQWFTGDHSTHILPTLFLVICLNILLALFGGLWIFHTFLAIVCMTTYEFLRSNEVDYLRGLEENDFPFSKSPWWNIKLFCWTHGFELLWKDWRPLEWQRPVNVKRDSDDWWNHPWNNKYYSCC